MSRLFFFLSIVLALPSLAAQIVVLDLEAKGGVDKALAESLTPVLHAELSAIDGMSVVSQDDIRALLELEANKTMMGCNKTSCMTEIADSLGAELLARSTISKVGRDYVVSISLLDVSRAKVALSATGKARGGAEAAPEAIANAVRNTFKKELPRALKGPGSLSRRGFRAALAGLHKSAMDMRLDPSESRKRVILDLVNTELDYDAAPKLSQLDLAIRRNQSEARDAALQAKSVKSFEHFMKVQAFYAALWDDLGRVKEIRERARAKGTQPVASSLRFEEPEPLDRLDTATVKRINKMQAAPRRLVKRAVVALNKGQSKRFQELWLDGQQKRALTKFDSLRREAKRNKLTWDVLPAYATLPRLQEYVVEAMKRDPPEMVVHLREYKKGKFYTTRSVRLVKAGKKWRIKSW